MTTKKAPPPGLSKEQLEVWEHYQKLSPEEKVRFRGRTQLMKGFLSQLAKDRGKKKAP